MHYELIIDLPVPKRSSFIDRFFSPFTAGGIRQSMFTLISAAIGGGILCLPYVFSLVGVMLGIVILAFSSALAFISMRMLLFSAERTQVFSYGKLFAQSMEFRVAGPFLDVVTMMFGQGVVIAYFVFLGDFLPSLAGALGINLARTVSILGACILATPLVIPHRLSALKYLTPVSTLSLIVTAIVVLYKTPSMRSSLSEGSNRIDVVICSWSVLKAFAICLSSFICHTNVVSVAGELVKPTDARSTKIALRAALVQLVLYVTIGVSGYLSFSQTIQQNFLKGYSANDHLITLCRLLLSFTIFFGLPLNTNPTAKALVNLVQSVQVMTFDPLLPATPSDNTDPMRTTRIIAGLCVLTLGAIVSLFVPGIGDVIGLLGGTLGVLIMLVFPAFIFMKVFSEDMHSTTNKLLVLALLVAAVLCFSSVCMRV
jgi:amino acid permease